MAKLNFYDTDAVKAFVLDILIENAELKSDLDYEKKCSNDWFDRYKKADQQVKDLEAKVIFIGINADRLFFFNVLRGNIKANFQTYQFTENDICRKPKLTKNGTTNRRPGTVRDRLRLSDKRCIIEKQTWNSSKPIPNAWALTHLLTSTPSSA